MSTRSQAAWSDRSASGIGGTTAWQGWVAFAGIMMIMIGVFNIIDGLVALFRHTWYAVPQRGLLTFNFAAWGWLWLIIGVLVVAVGFAVLAGRTWGRVAGVVLVGLNAIGQLAFVSAYPIWSILIIALDVVVIYALIVHGGEVRAD
jgi:vacuolar-type H+-ATPase subunit I/STV1